MIGGPNSSIHELKMMEGISGDSGALLESIVDNALITSATANGLSNSKLFRDEARNKSFWFEFDRGMVEDRDA